MSVGWSAMPSPRGSDRRRVGVLLAAAALISLIGLLLHGPLAQDVTYHAFADDRPWLGIENGADVASNVPFLFVGLAGFLALLRARRSPRPPPRWVAIGFGLLSFGVATTAIGSSIYHLDPSNETLVYDRLPMSLGFAALSALVLGERLGARIGRVALMPAVVLGVASVCLWAASLDGHGGDDLRVYAFVQYFTLLTLVTLLVLVPEPRATRRFLFHAVLAYGLAKLLEQLDGTVLRATGGLVSGHTLKHVAAAVAAYCLVRWFSAGVSSTPSDDERET